MFQRVKSGFTIIELMLSMSIVSFLLLTITLMLMQMTNMMNRGNAIRELNSASRTINRDLTQTFNSLNEIDWIGPRRVQDADNNSNYVTYRTSGGQSGGAFCTGIYTYLWTIGVGEVFKYSYSYNHPGATEEKIRFIKIRDSGRIYCRTPKYTVDRDALMTDLLPANGESNLQIYAISFRSNDELHDVVSNQRAVNVSYVLGSGDTTRGNAKVVDENTLTCNNSTFSNTCVANRFDLYVRTLGRK